MGERDAINLNHKIIPAIFFLIFLEYNSVDLRDQHEDHILGIKFYVNMCGSLIALY